MPIAKAEELIGTLQGVISVRIVAGSNGSVEEIHLLTTDELPPKATVRNVESALMAQLGMRVSHKKISVATTRESAPRTSGEVAARRSSGEVVVHETAGQPQASSKRRQLYFEDIEVRRSRSQGVTCRVTLRKGEATFVGEAEGMESPRLRVELAAKAALHAIGQSEPDIAGVLGLEGCRQVDAFDRQFVLAGVTARFDREAVLLTGTAEVKESVEAAAVLAVLDATNRWVEFGDR
ncbi:MAG TPA: hypothetical protein VFK16_06350 [Gemmatimonadaceae bacterium]|nr:hypothetical protein [Gemmatimonadaceae bacterium]